MPCGMALEEAFGTTQRAARTAEAVDDHAESEADRRGGGGPGGTVVPHCDNLGRERRRAEHGNDMVREATGREDRKGGSDRRTELHAGRDGLLPTA